MTKLAYLKMNQNTILNGQIIQMILRMKIIKKKYLIL